MSDGILKRGDRYVARPYDPVTGKARWLGTFPTKKAARHAVAEFRVLRSSPERVKLSAFITEWLEQMRGRVRPRTHMDYTTTAGQILELMGDVPLNTITPKTVERFVAESSRRYAGNTVRKQLTRLRQMLSAAVRWGWLPRNPADGKYELPRANKRRVRPITPEQAEALVDAADDYYKPVFITAMQTGLRAGELFGLRWEGVDLDAETIHLTESIWERKSSALKSDAAHRTIHLTPQNVEALRRHRVVCPTPDGLVFPTPWGLPMASKTWSESVMIPTAKRAKLPDVRLHDLRHCFASILIREGCSPKLVQSLMGHSTIGVTYDTYGHLFPDEKEEAAAKVASYFQSQNSSSDEV